MTNWTSCTDFKAKILFQRGKATELHNFRYYLKAKDDGPDETQSETVIPVHDVMWAHVFQMDFLLFEELQGFVDILQAVNTHAAFGGPWLWEVEETEGPVLELLT